MKTLSPPYDRVSVFNPFPKPSPRLTFQLLSPRSALTTLASRRFVSLGQLKTAHGCCQEAPFASQYLHHVERYKEHTASEGFFPEAIKVASQRPLPQLHFPWLGIVVKTKPWRMGESDKEQFMPTALRPWWGNITMKNRP